MARKNSERITREDRSFLVRENGFSLKEKESDKMKKRVASLGILVMLFVAILLLGGCGSDAQQGPGGLQMQAKSGDIDTTLQITPGQVGPNQFVVTVTHSDGQLIKEGKAILHFSMEGMDHGKSEEDLKVQPDGKWLGEGPHIMMAGSWKVELEYVSPSGEIKMIPYSFQIEE